MSSSKTVGNNSSICCTPYYHELVKDLSVLECSTINSLNQHKFIANFDYYNVLVENSINTPESWDDTTFRNAPEGEYIVKGAMSSKKWQWNKKMYASSKKEALNIAGEISGDFYEPQKIIYRKYVPLKHNEVGINGLPFAYEWRLFFYKQTLLTSGYYWDIAQEIDIPTPNNVFNLALNAARVLSHYTNFFAIDVALTNDEVPIVIEVNDGMRSGLSLCDPNELYRNLANIWGKY